MIDSKEYINEINKQYMTVAILSDKNGSTVYKLRHKELGKYIILRNNSVPIPAYDTLKSLRHDNLPEVYDTLYIGCRQLVLEEFIDGITVAEVLESGLYTYNGAKQILIGVCLALQTLHSYQIVHRDIKPENIIITNSGAVKLIDLNASRRIAPGKSHDTRMLGTVGYASPEQMGINQCDSRTDIYALGVLLNVMLTGEHPSKSIAKGKAGRIVSKCTHIDPNSRFSCVQRLINAL